MKSQRLNRPGLGDRLTFGGALKAFSCFGKARRSQLDPAQLGWRSTNEATSPRLDVSQVRDLSAESAVALTAMHQAAYGSLPLMDSPNRPLSAGRVLAHLPGNSPSWVALNDGCQVLSLYHALLNARDDVSTAADSLVSTICDTAIPGGDGLNRLREVIRRFVVEALLNTYEHAYEPSTPCVAWLCASIHSRDQAIEQHLTDDAISAEERAHLSSWRGTHMLEIAVADIGVGVPLSLSATSSKIAPELRTSINGLSSGTAEYKAKRSAIHAELCYYSFDHKSTSKDGKLKPFISAQHALNWRGLYRCYRQVVALGGAIVISSGRGRAGYCSTPNGIRSFASNLNSSGDFPGTVLVARIPLPPQTLLPNEPRTRNKDAVLPIEQILSIGSLLSGSFRDPFPTLDHTPIRYIGITLAFDEISEEGDSLQLGRTTLTDIRNSVMGLPHHVIPIFCFAAFQGSWSESLRAFVQHWKPAIDGPPRIVGVLGPSAKISWTLVGAIPQEAATHVEQFETTGAIAIGNPLSDSTKQLFAELKSHYRGAIIWDRESSRFHLAFHHARLTNATYKRCLGDSFVQYWSKDTVRAGVETHQTNCLVLLPTGTYIKRHFSAFRLLNGSFVLTRALSNLFISTLTHLFGGEPGVLALDRDGSRFVASALLEPLDCRPGIHSIQQLVSAKGTPRRVVIFADIILRGQTVEHVVSELHSTNHVVVGIVVLADLRAPEERHAVGGLVPQALLNIPDFCPEIVVDPGECAIIQTDSITNVPLAQASSRFLQLTENAERQLLLTTEDTLFRTGFHIRGGRTHTVSLPVQNIIDLPNGPNRLAKWTCDLLMDALHTMQVDPRQGSVVIFTWHDARCNQIVSVLVQLLLRTLGAKDIFTVRMHVERRGSDTIYPSAGSDPLIGCVDATSEVLEFGGSKRPKSPYIAIYLTDSAVTGNSLRDFLHRAVTEAEPHPIAVIALAIVNRLSPAEVRFFDLCTVLTGRDICKVPFQYRYIFTLQVRSKPGMAPASNPLIEAVTNDPALRIGELREYVELLHMRMTLSNTSALQHLFYPNATPLPVSSDSVRFRHLLALNQQNEPVVVELVSLLCTLTNGTKRDASILTLLALEPGLVQAAPLRQFGGEAVVSLALRVLSDNTRPLPLRSDALATIAAFPLALTRHLRHILPSVLEDSTLRLQTLALLLVQPEGAPGSATSHLEACLPSLNLDKRRIAQAMVRLASACSDLQALQRRPDRDIKHRSAITLLGNSLLHHAAALEFEWDGAAQSISNSLVEISTQESESKKRAHSALHSAHAFAERVIIPAFAAMAYFARIQGLSRLAIELEEGSLTARDHWLRLKRHLARSSNSLTRSRLQGAYEDLTALRNASWVAPSSDRLSTPGFAQDAVGVLPIAMERLFSAPSNLLTSLARQMLPDIRHSAVFASIIEFEGGSSPSHLTVSPIPTSSLLHIFKLLLSNVKQHGDMDSLRVTVANGFPRVSDDGTHSWGVEIVNVGVGAPAGQQQGLVAVQAAAAGHAISVESTRQDNKHWLTRVSISNCFYFGRT